VLVLASASPRRKALLAEAGIEHRVLPVDVDETPPPGVVPVEVALALAERKALAAATETDDRPLLAADTIVVLDGLILGKPADAADAAAMLRALSGRSHEVITGVCVLPSTREGILLRAVVTAVRFRELDDAEIDAYVASGEPLDKAGSYGIQGGAGKFVAELDGSLSNVIGLPVEEVREMLI
jgi:septum formation protein